MENFDVAKILALSVEKVTAQLADMTIEQRQQLLTAEKGAANPRKTLVANIEAFDKPAEEEGDAPPVVTLGEKPVVLATALAEAGRAFVFFTEPGDVPAVKYPPLEFEAGAFEFNGDQLVLAKDIVFEHGGPAIQLDAVWLAIEPHGTHAVGVSRLQAPLHGGGGRKALLPARSLAFRNAD